jgi:hypothetical protein
LVVQIARAFLQNPVDTGIMTLRSARSRSGSGSPGRETSGGRLERTEVRFSMLITIAPLLLAIIGLLIYVLASNAKTVEIGRIMFACGLLVSTWYLGSHMTKLF